MEEITQAELEQARFGLRAASCEAWRNYPEADPVPGYFQFDWISARHPDLYHRFALSTLGFMNELNRLVDLRELEVLDIGAGTGRVTTEAAKKARKVTAIDIYASVLAFAKTTVHRAGLYNVGFIMGDNCHLPLRNNSFDAALCAWAVIDHAEAYRVLKPGGYLIDLIPVPGGLCGELTALLSEVFPHIVTEIAPDGLFDPACPDSDALIREDSWNGVPVIAPVIRHDFTYVTDYGEPAEAAAILGRIYGPKVKRYMLDRRQSTISWRLRIEISRVRK